MEHRRWRELLVLVSTAWIAIPGIVAAQSSDRSGPAIEGAVLGRFDTRDDRLPATTAGGGASFIYQKQGRLSVRFEVDESRTRNYQDATVVTPHPDGTTTVFHGHRSFRSGIEAAVFGYRFSPSPRMDIAPLVGAGIERRSFGNAFTLDTVNGNGNAVAHQEFDQPFTATWLAAVGGIEASFHATRHLGVVPGIRLWWTPQIGDGCCTGGHLTYRVALRWSFG